MNWYFGLVVWNLEVTHSIFISSFVYFIYLTMSQNILENTYVYVALSHFKYDASAKNPIKIYCSTFFTSEKPKHSEEDISFYLGDLYFDNLYILFLDKNNLWGKRYNDLDIKGRQGSRLKMDFIGFSTFFSHEFLFELLVYSNSNPKTKIVLFTTATSWKTIKIAFNIFNIEISGGNNTLKHILSPQQVLLTRVIMLFYGNNTDLVNKSFIEFASNKDLSRAAIDFTSERDKLLLEGIKNKLLPPKIESNIEGVKHIKNVKFPIVQKKGFHSSVRLKSVDYKECTYFPYLSRLSVILNDSNKTDVEKQLIFENFLNEFIKQQIEDDQIFTKKYNAHLQNFSKGSIKEAIYEAMKTYSLYNRKGVIGKVLPNSNEEGLKLIILSYSIIISYFGRLGYTSIAALIGRTIMENLYLHERSRLISHSKNKTSVIKFDDYLKYKEVDTNLIIKIGDYFISLLSQFPHNIFERDFDNSTKNNREISKIIINSEYLNTIRDNLIIPPANLPMISKPVNWSSKTYGGYLKNGDLKHGVITKSSDNKHQTKNMKLLYKAVNILNSTKFSVNNLLLNYLLNEGKFLLQEVKPKDELQRTITLKLAETLSKTPFYLTVRSDWRGRLVTESFFLTYQGNDLSLALINFWDGESLTDEGLYYFQVYGANTHNIDGLSKKSYIDRIKWVKDNYDKIITLDRELILSAENPFSFASFCLNMKEIDRDRNWVVKSPIFLDATCSGIQHLAGLLRDLELGSRVNLVSSTHSDIPADIYSSLLDPINNAINKFGEDNIDYSHFALIKFNRKNIKQSIMTKVYNVTTFGISNQLKNNIDIVNEEQNLKISEDLKSNLKYKSPNYYSAPGKNGPVLLSNSDLMKIAAIINDEIFVVYPSLNYIYSYFIEMAKLVVKLGVPLSWVTPVGLEIVQHYLETEENKIGINIFGKRKTLVLRNVTDNLNTSKQIQAIIPNIIHSLDASHLIRVINSSIKGGFYPVITIHDCFGTHPNKMDVLSQKVKTEFALLYGGDSFLHKFHKHIISTLRANNYKIKKIDGLYSVYFSLKDEWIDLPKIPKLGELDLNAIKESSYMIT